MRPLPALYCQPAVSSDELLAITLRALSERALGRSVPPGLIAACLHQLAAGDAGVGAHVARISALALADWNAARPATPLH